MNLPLFMPVLCIVALPDNSGRDAASQITDCSGQGAVVSEFSQNENPNRPMDADKNRSEDVPSSDVPSSRRSPAGLAAEKRRLHGSSSIRFASLEQGKSILLRTDRFVERLSPFDRQDRLQSAQAVSTSKYLQFTAEQVLSWQRSEIDALNAAIGAARARLAPLNLNFPEMVWLIKTSGKEEGGAAYCRANAVVLPRPMLRRPPQRLERLLLHELFHILSSHNPRLRSELYKIVGFTICPEIAYPPSLHNRRITNPDAPVIDCYIELDDTQPAVRAVPILYASVDRYDPQQGGTMFRYLQFKLMVIEQSAGKWQAALRAGDPILMEPRMQPSFMRQIGGNTKYIIHPDEILADNFVLLATDADSVPSPEILARMRQVLKR